MIGRSKYERILADIAYLSYLMSKRLNSYIILWILCNDLCILGGAVCEKIATKKLHSEDYFGGPQFFWQRKNAWCVYNYDIVVNIFVKFDGQKPVETWWSGPNVEMRSWRHERRITATGSFSYWHFWYALIVRMFMFSQNSYLALFCSLIPQFVGNLAWNFKTIMAAYA